MKSRYALSLLVATTVAACSGGSQGTAVVPGSQPVPGAAIPSASSSFTYNASALKHATFVSAATGLSSISVDLVPKMQNTAGLLQYAKSVNDPRNGMYRHFLTPQQIGDQYGASQSTYAGAVKYFQSAGLSVGIWPQRLLLHVTGSQAKMQAALHTTFGWYRSGSSVFLAPMNVPSLASSVGIVGAANIVMQPLVAPTFVTLGGSAGEGYQFGYSPQQIAAAFDYTGAYAAGYTGAGITAGVIGTGGFSPSDVPAYRTMFGVGGSGTATVVSATDANAPGNTALGFASPPPVTMASGSCPLASLYSIYPTPTCNPEDYETQLDTEQISSLAPDANLHYYLAYNPNDGCGAIGVDCPPGAGVPAQGLAEVDAEIETAIAENKADVLSLSFGGPESLQVGSEFNASAGGIEPLEFAALASEGIAVFVSSGDSGAEGCQRYSSITNPNVLCMSYPASDPSVVAVGGVNTPLNPQGQLTSGLTGWGTPGSGGSGGGISAYFTQPVFQAGAAGVTGSMRNVPDISLEADSVTGVTVLLYGGAQFSGKQIVSPIGGTSVAAPEAAAMWALVLQACKQSSSCATATGAAPYRLGNPNAYFYKAYANATTYADTFYDVLYGSNDLQCMRSGPTPCPTRDPGYAAGKGYDLVTGIGVPFARALIKTVVGK